MPGDDIERRRPEEDSREKLQELIGKLLGDVGGAMSALVLVGDKLGFYRTLAEAAPLAPMSLAARTGTTRRCVRELQRCSSHWKCTASNLTRQLDTNPKMFAHTAVDRAGKNSVRWSLK